MTQSKIYVLGSINLDISISTSKIPQPGETVAGSSLLLTPGGKGANQAYGMSKYSTDIYMVGRVGDDIFATNILEHFSNSQLNTQNVSVDKNASTGLAVISVDNQGENSILAVYGANMECGQNEIDLLTKSLSANDYLVIQNEIPFHVNLKSAKLACEIAAKVIWDPAPYVQGSAELLKFVDIVTPNVLEAESLSGINIDDDEGLIKALKWFKSHSKNLNPIITLGKDGVAYLNNDELEKISSFDVNVVDSVAAGDAFVAGLTIALSNSIPLDKAIVFAQANAAVSVTKQGAQSSMPVINEVQQLLN